MLRKNGKRLVQHIGEADSTTLTAQRATQTESVAPCVHAQTLNNITSLPSSRQSGFYVALVTNHFKCPRAFRHKASINSELGFYWRKNSTWSRCGPLAEQRITQGGNVETLELTFLPREGKWDTLSKRNLKIPQKAERVPVIVVACALCC